MRDLKLPFLLMLLSLGLATSGCPEEDTTVVVVTDADVTDVSGVDGGGGGDTAQGDATTDVAVVPDVPVVGDADVAGVDGGPVDVVNPPDTQDVVDPDVTQDAGDAGPCVPNPCTEAPAPECMADGVTLVTYAAPGTCTAGAGGAECEFPPTEKDCSVLGGTCADGACVGEAVQPTEGEVIVTEIMYDPQGDLSDDKAEWFELTNVSAEKKLLDGCTVADASSNPQPITGIILEPGGTALFARSDTENGGLTPDHLFSFNLNNTGDAVTLACGGVVIDTVAFDNGATFPKAQGKSLSLDPGAYDAATNDDGASWCTGQDVYYAGATEAGDNYGTPGAANTACLVDDTTVDWCRLQWPLDAEEQAGTPLVIYGRVFDEGVTDLTTAVDTDPMLVGQAGYGPDGSDPEGNPEWTWTDADANVAWDDTTEGEPGNDEYQATVVVPAAGTYDHAFRFSLDGGETFTYCDRLAGEGSDGSEDGYQIENAGSLVSLPSPCDPNPCTEVPDPSCAEDGVTLLTYSLPGTCTVVDGGSTCTFDSAETDCSVNGAVCDAGACTGGAPLPEVGEVIVTEIMYDTEAELSENAAEWFELHNLAGAPRTLNGCTVGDGGGAKTPVSGVTIPAGGYALFARSASNNGGLDADGLFTFALNNSQDLVTLECNETVIDTVAYDDGLTFPDAKGYSISLDPSAYDAELNDDGANWCLGQDLYYTGQATPVGDHYGSPGAANPPCPAVDTTVDWCRLQWPLDEEALAGTPLMVYGRVYDEGVTDATPLVDFDPALVGQAGYGPDGTDPDGNPEWKWYDAEANLLWDGATQGEPNNDEYQASVVVPAVGTYDHAYRFSLDGGTSWTYCDRDAGEGADGSENGYQVADAGSLVSLPSPCDPNPCTVADAPACDADGVTLITYTAPGSCEVDGTTAVCTYESTTKDCSVAGGTCSGGACVGGAPLPAEGEVIVTEILYDPEAELSEATSEWFELTNLASTPRNLDGCVLGDSSSIKTTIEGLVIEANGSIVFARSLTNNGGLDVAHTFAFALNNDKDTITLTCDSVLVDAVSYDEAAGSPNAKAASLSLDPAAYDSVDNDSLANWCLGQDLYYTGMATPVGDHYGTPGADNPPCPEVDTTVDWCRLQWPLDAQELAGTTVLVYGRVYDEGITDQSAQVDADAMLVGQAGVGPDGSDPTDNGDWAWFDATPNAAWEGTGVELDNDEYEAEVSVPAVGMYDHAYRFSLDGGTSWTYCDRDAGVGSDGSEDGYQVANAGSLESLPSPCDPNPCTVATAPECDADGVTLITYTAPGTCAVDGVDAVCTYPSTTKDCSANGGTCDAGACVGGEAFPAEGEVIITEIMYDTEADLVENNAEWFELHNLADGPRSLDGCIVGDTSAISTTLAGIVIPAGGDIVLARSLTNNGGLSPAGTFTFTLNNGVETVKLTCDGVLVDQVAYDDGGTFPDGKAKSISLDPAAYDATANDDGANWCLAQDLYFTGSATPTGDHYGTPGAGNPSCPEVDTVVDWCRLQWPLDEQALAGTTLTVFGRVYDEGITDISAQVDEDPALKAQAGYGPDQSDPLDNVDWVWFDAKPNAGWDGVAQGEAANDEYEATVVVPAVGMYDHAYRFSLDGGFSWTYCDRDAGAGSDGSEDGYQVANAGSLESLPSPCDPNPCTEPTAPECDADGVTLITYSAPGTCAVDGVSAVCTFPSTTKDCSANGGTCSGGACVGGAQAPVEGEVIVTEIMYDTQDDLSESSAEWFELYNLAAGPRWLDGCVLGDGSTTTTTVTGVVIPAGGYAVFARSTTNNGGLEPDHTFAFALNNDKDTISLTCGGVLIDSVSYDEGAGFPIASAHSLSLDPGAYDATANDAPGSWCLAQDLYYTGDLPPAGDHYGTPGSPNPTCPVVDTTVDWCRLQWPLDIAELAGTEVTVFGRVYEAGITDATTGVDADPALVGQVGYGPDASDPTGNPDWSWIDASPNPEWDGAVAGEADNDEYEATFAMPAMGVYDHAYRFSVDGGATWTYCDGDQAGSDNGYLIESAGALESLSSPCDPNPCTEATAPECDADGVTLITYSAPGTCSVDGVSAVCTFPSTTTDCSANGGTCSGGACVGGAPPPAEGEVIVTEIMYDTQDDLSESSAEWFELTNLAAGPRWLDGCVVKDESTSQTTISGLLIPAGGTVVFARSATNNGGLTPDHTFSFALNNGNDTVGLICDDLVIDAVSYDEGAGWPIAVAHSISLDPSAFGAAANDDPASWCLGQDLYYTGIETPVGDHYGSPGVENPSCPVVDTTVDWCRLQWPLDIAEMAGTEVTVFGRVYEAGITDATTGVDADPALVGQVGYGPDASDPTGNPDWSWIDATPNPEWDGAVAGEADNDEYEATFSVPAVGVYDHAYRFSVDGGATWTYCDGDQVGSDNGYQVDNAGAMESLPGPCDPNPCDQPTAPECDADGVTLITYSGPGSCVADGANPVCTYPSTTQDCSANGGTCSGGACSGGAPAPAEGEVIVTEILYDPEQEIPETSGEWFELTNLAAGDRWLDGCEVSDAGGGKTTISGLLIPAGGSLVFARSMTNNGGLTVDHTFSFGLNNDKDTITLACGGVTVDMVSYDEAGGFPNAVAHSLSLDPSAYDATANDDPTNWCLAQDVYYTGVTPPVGDHFGTPGAANPVCPVIVDTTVDWCRLQWPLVIAELEGTEVTVYGRVYEAGITDASAGVDSSALLMAQVGYGPDASDPAGNGAWTWMDAAPNPLWDGVAAGEAENDEYEATFPVPAVGLYDHAYRFSVDGGVSWSYCDGDTAGTDNGYQIAEAGSLESLTSPCDPNPCTEQKAAECDAGGEILTTYTTPGECAVDGLSAVCTYPSTTTDCTLDGGTCSGGACVGGAPLPIAGEVVITEILYDTEPELSDALGEWFEVTNVASGPRFLGGCVVGDTTATKNTLAPLLLPAGGTALFARSMANNGGLAADQPFTFTLNNDTDTITLACDGVTIDAVTYDEGAGFPVAIAHSISLDPGAYDATLNDDPANWCLAQDVYFTGAATPVGDHYGTPGAVNPACPAPLDTTVDWCVLQWPLDVTQQAGTSLTVYGRLYEAGLTELTSGVDPSAQLVAEAGFGPDGSDPAGNGDWTWNTAVANPTWDGVGAGEPDNDEYQAIFSVPAVGTYDHAYRFSLDSGATWTYCDIDGTDNGYDVASAGNLVSEPTVCDPNPCTEAKAPECDADGVTLVTYTAPGTCAPHGATFTCTFPSTTFDCSTAGGTCSGGACVGLAPMPVEGEVIVTEILYDTEPDLTDTAGEWFELTNVADGPRYLDGCTVGDGSGATKTIAGVLVPAGGTALFARSATNNGGLVPAQTFSFGLNNDTDTLTLTCAGVTVDQVTYDENGGFPVAIAASLSLDPAAYDSVSNDDPANWCLGQAVYYTSLVDPFTEHLGTPGATNPSCPVVLDGTVDWCALQWPLVISEAAGSEVVVFGRVKELGLTDLSDGVDPHPDLLGEVGYGPGGSDPTGNADWTWVASAPNPTWHGSGAGAVDIDEYQATLTVPDPGTYDHAYRFSADGGATWTYCDGVTSDDGYQIADAGSLESLADPCAPNPCTEVKAPECDIDGISVITYDSPGTCDGTGGVATCTYASSTVHCPAGDTCEGGLCMAAPPQPVAGEVIVTEILYDTQEELAETSAEWFELYNMADGPRLLDGCVVGDESATTTTVSGITIPAGGYVVFARSLTGNGGIAADHTFSFALNNGNDTVSLTCGGVLVDSVSYNETGGWPIAIAASLSLDPAVYDGELNDDPDAWCLGQDIYYTGVATPVGDHWGTPGAANPGCPPVDTTVDWCRLQWPLEIMEIGGTQVDVYGRVYEAGITDQSAGSDPNPGLIGQVGYGPDQSDPVGNFDWAWTSALPNMDWDGVAGGEADNDEYVGSITVPTAEAFYAYAYRFSRDGGKTWSYCDGDAEGTSNGYQVAQAGLMLTLPSPCEPNPCTVAPDPACDPDGVTLITPAVTGLCTVVADSYTCDYDTDATTTDCSANGGTCSNGACEGGYAQPAEGEVVITEIMYDTDAELSETSAEWFELHSNADVPVSLNGCVVHDGSTISDTVGGLILQPGGYLLFVRSDIDNGGLTPDHLFSFTLNNTNDTLALECGGVVVDQVVYDEHGGFPIAAAQSLSLDPAGHSSTSNDNPASWCLGVDLYYTGLATPVGDHFGTPGAPNPPCPVVDTTVDWCRLQWPIDETVQAGSELTVYGRVYEDGLTTLSDGVDTTPLFMAEAGYGPDGTDPAVSAEWVWVGAVANPTWSGTAAGEADNDEYQATFAAPATGTYDHAYRFSLDAGFTWLYCDRNAGLGSDGTQDGYQIANAGSLVTTPNPCDPNPCEMVPGPVCDPDGVTLITTLAPGTCIPSGESYACEYTEVTTNCADSGGTCAFGECVGGVPVAPLEGELIITEIMFNPSGDIPEGAGEWFEVYNTTGLTLSLDGCVVADNSATTMNISGVTVAPQSYALFAGSGDTGVNGGLVPDGIFAFGLANTSDKLTFTCGATVIDEVVYSTGTGFPSVNGSAISLDPASYDATLNDSSAAWCVAVDVYHSGSTDNHGTPGAVNPSCL